MIFDVMPQQRGVYLFDEFDSIGSQRQHGQDIGEIKRILNSFLINIEKDNSNSIIIAATNLPDLLDKALFRRFDDIINYCQLLYLFNRIKSLFNAKLSPGLLCYLLNGD
jgi:SpoVK/Ycf46/Vps4 family AAA+-type ATPase